MTRLSERLRPAGERQGNTELLACLILVAPSGMTTEDRDAWLRAAKMTLSGIPADLLQRGAKVARERCKFASEIVPTIMDEVKGEWGRRKRAMQDEQARWENRNAPRLAEPDMVDPAEVRKLIRSLGSAA